MKIKRDHGRILSVETQVRGSTLDEPAAVGATTLIVQDAGDFDEDGGTLAVGGVLTGDEWDYANGQVVTYTDVDDDAGVITLASALTVAVDSGDPVHAWSVIYDEPVEYQVALVQLDGDYDNEDPVEAEVSEGVDDLDEGDRGGPGESCMLHRISADEWEVVAVGGRSRKSRSLKFEADDAYTLTAADITAGTATFPLSHRPIDESVKAVWRTTPQEPTEYTVNYDAQTITWPLSGFEAEGDRLWVHYAYRKGIATPTVVTDPFDGLTLAAEIGAVAPYAVYDAYTESSATYTEPPDTLSDRSIATGLIINGALQPSGVFLGNVQAAAKRVAGVPGTTFSSPTAQVWMRFTVDSFDRINSAGLFNQSGFGRTGVNIPGGTVIGSDIYYPFMDQAQALSWVNAVMASDSNYIKIELSAEPKVPRDVTRHDLTVYEMWVVVFVTN